jgi:hypothetical protein
MHHDSRFLFSCLASGFYEKAIQGLAGEPKATKSPLAGKRLGRFPGKTKK